MFKRFRSLRWRLQVWHSLILLLVIVGLGTVLHWEIVRSQWDHIDEELLSAARILDGSLRVLPQPILNSMAQDLTKPLGPRLPIPMNDDRGREFDRPPRQRPSSSSWWPFRSGPPGSGPPPVRNARPSDDRDQPIEHLQWELPSGVPDEKSKSDEEWEAQLALPRSLPEQLGRTSGPAYFFIWRRDGTTMKQSNVPDPVLRDLTLSPRDEIVEALNRDRFVRLQRGPWREVYIRGHRDTTICVGRSVIGEQRRTGRLTMTLFGSGTAILLAGLFGGWWLSGRAIQPIKQMSKTAGEINENQLTKRMELAGVDTELAELGSVLNQMLDRLGSSIEQQRRFTADASHELRTPLSAILSSSELALSKPRSSDEYREHLERCERAARRMQNLIESLLTLARLDAEPTLALSTVVELDKVIRDSVQLLEPLATDHQVTVTEEVAPCKVMGDSGRLGQAFVNLVTNGIKYNVAGGTVQIRSSQDERSVTIEVIDSGIGIAEKDIPHLFERFYRVDEARSRRQGGTGLGLSICERIVSSHGGEIGVRSSVGTGSIFWIKLPIAT